MREWRSLENKVIILMYHRIADEVCDPWGLCVTPRHFEQQMEVLRKSFCVIPIHHMVESLADGAICQQEVFLANAAGRELRGKRAIGQRRLGKHHYARGLLVESVNDSQSCPPGLPMPQPVVEPLAGERTRRVRVQAGRFVRHQQMVILEDQARQHCELW